MCEASSLEEPSAVGSVRGQLGNWLFYLDIEKQKNQFTKVIPDLQGDMS